MDDGDPIETLRRFINGRWAAVQRTVFPSVPELRFSLDAVTRPEAEWFLEAVIPHRHEPALFTVEDNNKYLSVRYPPNAGDTPRGNVFFEKSPSGNWCVLRLETIVHQGATWRLHDEFRWPLSHLSSSRPMCSTPVGTCYGAKPWISSHWRSLASGFRPRCNSPQLDRVLALRLRPPAINLSICSKGCGAVKEISVEGTQSPTTPSVERSRCFSRASSLAWPLVRPGDFCLSSNATGDPF